MKVITKHSIIDSLKEIGIRTGMELEVHSSLRSFGYVEGGAETIISALKESCDVNGSIFMPSLRLSPEMEITEQDRQLEIITKIKILPENCDRSAMGLIADTFRKQPETQTGEGIFRISGWGQNAHKAVEGGLDYVIHSSGKALLLGVDIYKLTAMHYVESIMPEAISNIFAPQEVVNKVYPPDEWFIETGAPPVKAWYTIQKMAYEKGLIKNATIGECQVMFFDLWDIVGLYEQQLLSNPYKLFGLK